MSDITAVTDTFAEPATTGFSSAQAAARLEHDGPNALPRQPVIVVNTAVGLTQEVRADREPSQTDLHLHLRPDTRPEPAQDAAAAPAKTAGRR